MLPERCLFSLGLVGTEGILLMVLFAELIVLFDLRLFEAAEGNEVFGQGFPQAKFSSQLGQGKKGKKSWRKGKRESP